MSRFEKLKLYIESRGGQLLSNYVHWNNGNFEWLCENKHENSSKLQMLNRQSWCKDCIQTNTRSKVETKLSEKKYTLISYSSKKCVIICDKGHQCTMTASHITEGNGCGKCHKIKLKEGITRLSLNEVSNRLLNEGFEFLDNTYKNSNELHTIQCSKGHIFKHKTATLINGLVGCPNCNNYFRAENKFRGLLESIANHKFPKCRPEWLVNPDTKYRLELDCYNADLKLAFEYDGHFHYEVRSGLNNNLSKTKELDMLKEKLCKANGVKLIRVPYFLNKQERVDLIIREMDSGVVCPEEIKQLRAEARLKIVR